MKKANELTDKQQSDLEEALTEKQRRFCHEYVVHFNGTKAAIAAGYSKETARVQASQMLSNVKVAEFVKQLLQESNLGAEETKKLISDIAKSSLNDYFVIKQVEYTPRVKKPLAQMIQELVDEIEFEDEYADKAGLSEDAFNDHWAMQEARKLKKLRYELELKRNPKAYRIVFGENILVDQAELDLVKLTQDKESGKIKSFSYGQFGPKVEMYAADAALTNIAKIHGLYAPERADITTQGQSLNKGFAFFLQKVNQVTEE